MSSLTSLHYEHAARLLADHPPTEATHSEAYWEGYLEAVACYLADQHSGEPGDNPYTPGTSKRDAWTYGWHQGTDFAHQRLTR